MVAFTPLTIDCLAGWTLTKKSQPGQENLLNTSFWSFLIFKTSLQLPIVYLFFLIFLICSWRGKKKTVQNYRSRKSSINIIRRSSQEANEMQISNLKLKLCEISIPTKSPPGFILADGRIRKISWRLIFADFLKNSEKSRKDCPWKY